MINVLTNDMRKALAAPRCCAKDCEANATHTVVLEVYFLQNTRGRITRTLRPHDLRLDALGLCAAHGRTFTAEDILTDELWQTIASRSKTPLQRHRAKLKLAPL